jgi:hypothetical protein
LTPARPPERKYDFLAVLKANTHIVIGYQVLVQRLAPLM